VRETYNRCQARENVQPGPSAGNVSVSVRQVTLGFHLHLIGSEALFALIGWKTEFFSRL